MTAHNRPGRLQTVFLDRDGVINRDSAAYIKSWQEFEFLPGSLEALRRLTASGFTILVVTNQSAVGRGLISSETLAGIHRNMRSAIRRHGGRIRDVFFCPHVPQAGCDCRKPRPGLILQAQQRYGIDLEAAAMVGDSARDIACARRAGCALAVRVRSGIQDSVQQPPAAVETVADHVAENLLDAVRWLMRRRR